jgi:hypothetical protein
MYTAQCILNTYQAYFVDRCDMTRMKMKFIFAATADFCRDIDFFEQSKVHVHNTQEKMEDILLSQLRKCVVETELNNLDEETNEISKKAKRELIDVIVDTTNLLKNTQIFIGQEVEKEIKSFGLNPRSGQLTCLFESVQRFHITACKFLQKYFSTALKSTVMDNMSTQR